jgi:hypothetical protein
MCILFRMPAYADPGGTLTVRVGYMGYEYQTRAVYTSADLRALGTGIQYYSWVDGYPAPVMMAAEGVPLWNIIVYSGIDPGSVQRYYFRASDGHEAYSEFTSESLFYAARYWYPNLTNTWVYDEYGNSIGPGVGAEEGAQPTEPMIALREYHDRFLPAPRPDLMYDAAGFRLVYGAAYVGDPYASFHDSVYGITHIDVMLVGSPPEDPGVNDDDDYIGSDPSNETTETGSDEDGSGRGDGSSDGTGSGSGGSTGSGTGGSLDGDAGSGDGSAGIGDVEEITLGDGTVIKGREIKGSKILMELSYAGSGGGGKSDGDDPWSEYKIDEESVPLKLPYEQEAAAAVTGVTGLSFLLGAVAQGEIFSTRRRKRR